MSEHKNTFGLIIGNRGFFPDSLAEAGRTEMLNLLSDLGYGSVCLSPEDTNLGVVETYADARKCAELFKENAEKIDGIIVSLPNFGDEKGVADAIRYSGLDVPVLVNAFPDVMTDLKMGQRRDSFCGKISVCNNLRQYGIPYTLTTLHCDSPSSESFKEDLNKFAATCRVVKGLKRARFGAIGARTGAFNTVRYSEKLLEATGISVETIDLSEIFGMIERLKDNDQKVIDYVESIENYTTVSGIDKSAILKMAKMGVVISDWMQEKDLVGSAIQCWTSMEEYYGVVPCTLMSMMSQSLLPSACEVDMGGLIAMYALQLASNKPSAILDWNNNVDDDPDKTILFHCSNIAKGLLKSSCMDYQAIIAGTVGKENTYGTIVGSIKASPFTYFRISTDDVNGKITSYTGEGEFSGKELDTFGGYGVCHIPNLQGLLRFICENGFEHHVAVNLSRSKDVLQEAIGKYLGWDIYTHG
ncbi:MAG: fucose isomerase [FCB group bacterium]|nr:fucose isomerase [FCB group bacterium]